MSTSSSDAAAPQNIPNVQQQQQQTASVFSSTDNSGAAHSASPDPARPHGGNNDNSGALSASPDSVRPNGGSNDNSGAACGATQPPLPDFEEDFVPAWADANAMPDTDNAAHPLVSIVFNLANNNDEEAKEEMEDAGYDAGVYQKLAAARDVARKAGTSFDGIVESIALRWRELDGCVAGELTVDVIAEHRARMADARAHAQRRAEQRQQQSQQQQSNNNNNNNAPRPTPSPAERRPASQPRPAQPTLGCRNAPINVNDDETTSAASARTGGVKSTVNVAEGARRRHELVQSIRASNRNAAIAERRNAVVNFGSDEANRVANAMLKKVNDLNKIVLDPLMFVSKQKDQQTGEEGTTTKCRDGMQPLHTIDFNGVVLDKADDDSTITPVGRVLVNLVRAVFAADRAGTSVFTRAMRSLSAVEADRRVLAVQHAIMRTVVQLVRKEFATADLAAFASPQLLAFGANFASAAKFLAQDADPDFSVERIDACLVAIDDARINRRVIAEKLLPAFQMQQEQIYSAAHLVPCALKAMREIGATALLKNSFVQMVGAGANNNNGGNNNNNNGGAAAPLVIESVLGRSKAQAEPLPKAIAQAIRVQGIAKVLWHPVNAQWEDADVQRAVAAGANVVVPCREKFDGVVPVINGAHCAVTMRKLAQRAARIVVFRSPVYNTVVLFLALAAGNNNKLTAAALNAMTVTQGNCDEEVTEDAAAPQAPPQPQQQQQDQASAAGAAAAASAPAVAADASASAPAAKPVRRTIVIDDASAAFITPVRELRVTTELTVTEQQLGAIAGVRGVKLLHNNVKGGIRSYSVLYAGAEADALKAFAGHLVIPLSKLLRQQHSCRLITVKPARTTDKTRELFLLQLAKMLLADTPGAFAYVRYGALRLCMPKRVTFADLRKLELYDVIERAIADDLAVPTKIAQRVPQQQRQPGKKGDASQDAAAAQPQQQPTVPTTMIDVTATSSFDVKELKKIIIAAKVVDGLTEANVAVTPVASDTTWRQATVVISTAVSKQQIEELRNGVEIAVNTSRKKPAAANPQLAAAVEAWANADPKPASAASAQPAAAAAAAAAAPLRPPTPTRAAPDAAKESKTNNNTNNTNANNNNTNNNNTQQKQQQNTAHGQKKNQKDHTNTTEGEQAKTNIHFRLVLREKDKEKAAQRKHKAKTK